MHADLSLESVPPASVSPERALHEGEVTRLLAAAHGGDAAALDRLVPLVYDDLRLLARRQLRRHAERTLRPTELVHEAWMKLAGGRAPAASGRAHFLAIAARAMRQVLVDHARRHNATRRGGGWHRATLTTGSWAADFAPERMLALDAALEQLEPRQRQVVECRFFGGMEDSEIAAALGITDRTVRRDWVKARAWLYRALADDDTGSARALPA